jgi:uncharacterized protein (DUF2267 family)
MSETAPLVERQRVSRIAVLRGVLAGATEASVAAQLHISVRALRRYAAGEVKMNWVTHTRLMRMSADLEAKREADAEAVPNCVVTTRKRERVSGSYRRVASPAVALT